MLLAADFHLATSIYLDQVYHDNKFPLKIYIGQSVINLKNSNYESIAQSFQLVVRI